MNVWIVCNLPNAVMTLFTRVDTRALPAIARVTVCLVTLVFYLLFGISYF
jgi:hypothetical protein